MDISLEIHRYAPELTKIYFNGKLVTDEDLIKRIDLATLVTKRCLKSHIRACLNEEFQPFYKVVFTNGKSMIMPNDKHSVRAIKKMGWKIQRLEEIKDD